MNCSLAKFLLLIALPLGLIFFSAQLTGVSKAADMTRPSTAPSTQRADQPSTKPAFAAMAYYDQSCARCHGPQGTFYGPTLGQKLTDRQLNKVVDDMASGPGNAPLTPEQLPVETAFHRALIMRTPYLSVTQMGGNGMWTGEAMPDAKVTIQIGQQQIVATHDDTTWSAQLPATADVANVQITADLDGATTTLKPSVSAYSNTSPLPPPNARPK